MTPVYIAQPDQIVEWLDLEVIPWAKASRPLLVGMWQGKPACIFGLIPTSMISDSAYLWLWTAPKLPKIVFARHARRTMSKLLSLYPKLICNCYSAESVRWLLSLGARPAGHNLYIFHRVTSGQSES